MPEYGEGVSDGQLKRLIREELDGKEQSKGLKDRLDGIEKKLRLVGNMVCDEKGRCKLATAEQMAKLGKQQAEASVGAIDRAYKELNGQWEKLTPEQKRSLKILPKGAHQTMWELIFAPDSDSRKGGIRKVLESVTPEELGELLGDNPELAQTIAGALLCTTQECRDHYNKRLDELRKQKGQKKESWLVKK